MSNLLDPAQQARDAGVSVIAEPIINRPFESPKYYWDTVDWDKHIQKPPEKKEGRRPAGYFYNIKGNNGQGSLFEEELIELNCVNEIRSRVDAWRRNNYVGVTSVTRNLLEYWNRTDREQPLFYCQREAIETIIWLMESNPSDCQGLTTETVDGAKITLEQAHEEFLRYCCKMATGTGKTVVMAMLIAWQSLNKSQYSQDTRFTDAFLVMAPGVTVKDRLRVLVPSNPENFYQRFDLIPPGLRESLNPRICCLHRQEMAIKDDSKKQGPVKLGEESDSAFANRLLKRELSSTNRIFVLNDEGHHCYRPRLKTAEQKDDDAPTADEKKENERAAQWITGLEKINRTRNIALCIDFSATPFYIHGSGYPVGRPFPWIVSDFGLLDAIESGLVKIPVMPVDDDKTGAGGPPAYFHLWRWINDQLPATERYKQTGRGKGKPDAVARKAEPACVTMIGNWKRTFDEWEKNHVEVPPCMIVVCQDTEISAEVFKILTRKDWEFDHFANTHGKEVSYLYDSNEMKKVEEGSEKPKDKELRLREIMNSVGKKDKPGENVRLVCSVSMLTEGWDAQNVTQIIGLRAFTSQLLCEQVVGRALRRMSYEVDPETGMLEPEEAEIYGVPFQVIPVKIRKGKGTPPPPKFLVMALKERRNEFEIHFPRVEGYISEYRDTVVCDWEHIPTLKAERSNEPLEVAVGSVAGYLLGKPQAFGTIEMHDRIPYYLVARIQPALYRIAAALTNERIADGDLDTTTKRRKLFPQILKIVCRFVGEHIILGSVPEKEITLLDWQEKIIITLREHIHASDEKGEPIIIPRIERYRPTGSTQEVMFRTGRDVIPTQKSHISHVVVDTFFWEKQVTQKLEKCNEVQAFARNDHMGFLVPYLKPDGTPGNHMPDFIVRMKNELHIALEVKGLEREKDDFKKAAGEKWAQAVNNYYGEKKWTYAVVYDPKDTEEVILACLNE